MDKEQMKVLLPMIRQVLPMSVAASIMGIQPMESTIPMVTGESYVDEAASYATDANTVEWYWVKLPMPAGAIFNLNKHQQHIESVTQWCWDLFGSPQHHLVSSPGPVDARWTTLGSKFCFKYAEDRTAFVLKWS